MVPILAINAESRPELLMKFSVRLMIILKCLLNQPGQQWLGLAMGTLTSKIEGVEAMRGVKRGGQAHTGEGQV